MLHSPNKTNNFALFGLTCLSARGQLCHMCKIWSYGWWEATVPGIKRREGDRRKSTMCRFCRFALCDCTAATIKKKNLFCKLFLMIHIKPQNGRIWHLHRVYSLLTLRLLRVNDYSCSLPNSHFHNLFHVAMLKGLWWKAPCKDQNTQ